MVESLVARAYDAIAAEYDAQLEKNPVAVYMRSELHAHLARIRFMPERAFWISPRERAAMRSSSPSAGFK